MRTETRRFPVPWSAERTPAGWRVQDANGAVLAYVYGAPPDFQTSASGIMSESRAQTVAAAIATLPEVIQGKRPAPELGLTLPLEIEEHSVCFKVNDRGGYLVAAVYFGDPRAGDLTYDEARRIAASVARLPTPLK